MIARLSLGHRLHSKITLTALFVVLADLLLYRSLQLPPGLAFTLLLAALGTMIVLLTGLRSDGRLVLLTGVLFLSALLALLEDVSITSVLVALIALAALALAGSGRLRADVWLPAVLLHFLATGPFAIFRDLLAHKRVAQRRPEFAKVSAQRVRRLTVWVMPIVLTCGFGLLFAASNPVVGGWLAMVDLSALLALLNPCRLFVWSAAVLIGWPFLRPRIHPFSFGKRKTSGHLPAPLPRKATPGDLLFGRAAILRALLLFNALFALQTVLDGLYLWDGVSLPDGITHAAYAHRGAYMLVFTALLAAAFVLLAMRSGSSAAGDRRVQGLVGLASQRWRALLRERGAFHGQDASRVRQRLRG